MAADPAISTLIRAALRFDLRIAESDLASRFLLRVCLPLAFFTAMRLMTVIYEACHL
jgi:hypothetical protein